MPDSVTYLPRRRVAATKQRLIEAGVRLFTRQPGKEPTTRELAREAKVNHALISYHFGGVSELLGAVVDYCIADLRALFMPQLERFSQRIREADPADMLPLLEEHTRELFRILAGPQGTALLKAFGNPDSAALRGVYGRFSALVLQPLHHSFALTAAKMRGIPEHSLEAAVLGQCMTAQCMAFFRGARPVLDLLGKEAFTAQDMRDVARIVAGALCRTAGRPDAPA